ncbi:response regulator transcription factor [Paenibacillus sp. R14(2021)]|uniref:response regulator transcription factor n=1 Tax=Paenibacillus sp. R14(2021) TaxID=2859228 RepID=UPI001C6152E3|nr:response regulator transcription factor [Paenibacillus sp. R14(2021)]
MYDVLIVDDEPIARQSLRYLADWERLGFKVRAEAEDGLQALTLLKECRFALVLTDIRMPTMNGLELIAALREFSDAQVVIMSGYDDFEYAREGLKLGVKDYLLKPVDEDELEQLLERLAAELNERQLLERRERLGITAGRDRLLRRIAHGTVAAAEIRDHMRLLGMQPHAQRYACLLAEFDFMAGGDVTDREAELKRFALRNIAEELCLDRGYVFEDAEDRLGLLLGGAAEETSPQALRAFAERLCASAANFAKETVTVGLGRGVGDVGELKQSWTEAEAALDGKFLSGPGAVLEARGKPFGDDEQTSLRGLEADVLDAVRHFRRADAQQAVGRLWDGFRTERIPEHRAKLAVLELLIQLYRIVKEQGAGHERLFDASLGEYERVMRSRTIDDLRAFAEAKINGVLDALLRMKELRPNKIVEDVRRIVQARYAENVSLRSVAQEIYMNPNYIGKLFKAHTDMTFNDYVLQVRMEKAKDLLLQTDKKVYEIAHEVGFGELDWFYKRFKTYAGVSAGDFRGAR